MINFPFMSDKEKLAQLEKIFQEFMQASTELERSYRLLQSEARLLSSYLGTVLENMPEAILIFNNQQQLVLANQNAKTIFSEIDNEQLKLGKILEKIGIRLKKTCPLKMQKEILINQEKRWFEINLNNFFNERDEKVGLILVLSDKTELKLMEQKNQQKERLSLMGKVAAEMAHDIRNPLASIELMLELLMEQLPETPENIKTSEHIRKALFHVNRLISNVLFYTKNMNVELSSFPFAELIAEIENELQNELKDIELIKKIPRQLIKADYLLMKQALLNLFQNSIHFLSGNTRRVIEISAAAKSNYFEIRFKDNGCGIPQNLKKYIFQPFFSTRSNGTGLGLAIVKRIVDAHKGRISFRSGNAGTSFKLQIPLK